MQSCSHNVDFCVIGGGLAGICAAVSAARQGLSVLIMQDRPMFGGNASSEIRMHISGADRSGQLKNLRETGIVEELLFDNLLRNPQQSYSIWDTVLYEKIIQEPNITYLLNCSCLEAHVQDNTIKSVTGWQLTTETWHTVHAPLFADCSGDGILAPLTGAQYRMGREGKAEFNESIAPENPDAYTMGMTCMFSVIDCGKPVPFIKPDWAYTFATDDDLPFVESHAAGDEDSVETGAELHAFPSEVLGSGTDLRANTGYWWIERGGDKHSIHDAEQARDELLKIVYGVWDHIKNQGNHDAGTLALDWIQFLPGKRESRRYQGAHILTQNDLEAGGQFDDTVAYGGWTMDNHDPAGFWSFKNGNPSTHWHPCPSPYGIPLRSLYSCNINNLMFAGRCLSATHAAMSSARVMGTAAAMGAAIGNAAVVARKYDCLPQEVSSQNLQELQQLLIAQDCYLPGVMQRFSELMQNAMITASSGDPSLLTNGINRPVKDEANCWEGCTGDSITLTWPSPVNVKALTLISDSALDKNPVFSHCYIGNRIDSIPEEMLRSFSIEIQSTKDGEWQAVDHVSDNYRRRVCRPINRTLTALRITPTETWGQSRVRLFSLWVD